ncbi:MAG TPA: fumarate hydratase [Clostridia bacterium]
MKVISADQILSAAKKLIADSVLNIESQTCALLRQLDEKNEYAKWALDQIIENINYAKQNNLPPCQDTGLAVFFLEIGQDVHITGGYIEDVLNEAVRQAYAENYFRKSTLDPISRINFNDNTPAIIHARIVKGDNLTIAFLAKGAGSENMSALYMLTPSKSRQGIIDCVVDCVRKAGANPCPPIIIGVGVGGDMEKACLMAKHALTRPTGEPAKEPDLRELEQDILKAVNKSGIGIQGFGGDNTAISVAVEKYPTHIGMLPVAVNIQCHSVRHGKIVL